jgi:alginate O-acetyltransferase complex protein AlgI
VLFNSLSFAIFLPVVFLLYWYGTKGNLKIQNVLLLLASYFFYSCWDWRFLFLLVFSTGLDYFTGFKIDKANSTKHRKFWLWLSISANLGFLGTFKYYNFFAQSFADFVSGLGVGVNIYAINVILPVGISFYTFHGLSYVLDIYYKRINAEVNFIDYSVFVSFFPLLVAGPIERATHLLPQIKRERNFDYSNAVNGMRQIIWGIFKKVVIADNCATYANQIFSNPSEFSGSTLVVGAFFFTIQIYCDFSGYSDIALGTARLFGIELLQNFSFPYFSRSIAEFWRRWHISLSSWFRDYLYIPLGGSKGGNWLRIRNTLLIFVVSGFWHGANWTFIFWGLLNAILIMPSILLGTNRADLEMVAKGKHFPSVREFCSIALTFILINFAWIFFRSNTLSDAFIYISKIFSVTIFSFPRFSGMMSSISTLLLIALLFVFEWAGRFKRFPLEDIQHHLPRKFRWSIYFALVCLIGIFMQTHETQFIYFQF